MVAFSTALGTDRLFGLSNLPEPDRVATVEVAVDGRLRRSGDVFDLGFAVEARLVPSGTVTTMSSTYI
ncbi:hypothetical protein [Natrialba swarupiae]|uniref:Uncharacterized protein n=1 Tax=Natrialba swarupiae TaxID=2448032 RepID=A0A5D5AF36_9EURY|nr:hypothetical protein [Natrialba swarupiae]MCW8173254.1 hypothetical protein [Natrialba swarupiae]TYT60399.1 hypothetical protein FYC77_18990 [Natrialba swarupiae]